MGCILEFCPRPNHKDNFNFFNQLPALGYLFILKPELCSAVVLGEATQEFPAENKMILHESRSNAQSIHL